MELIYSIQDQLLKYLESLFLRSVLELIEALKDCGTLTNNDPVHVKLLDIYTKHCFNKPLHRLQIQMELNGSPAT